MGKEVAGFLYQHSDAAATEEDGAGEVFAVVVGDFGLELHESELGAAEPVACLDVDFAELVGGLVEDMVLVLLLGEGLLEGGDPVLEGGEG